MTDFGMITLVKSVQNQGRSIDVRHDRQERTARVEGALKECKGRRKKEVCVGGNERGRKLRGKTVK